MIKFSPRIKKVSLISLFSLMLIVIAFWSSSCSYNEQTNDWRTNFTLKDNTVNLDNKYTKGLGYQVIVSGTLTNKSGKTWSYIQISFSLFDENGALMGTAFDNINYFANGSNWAFEANSFEWYKTKAVKVTLSDISYF